MPSRKLWVFCFAGGCLDAERSEHPFMLTTGDTVWGSGSVHWRTAFSSSEVKDRLMSRFTLCWCDSRAAASRNKPRVLRLSIPSWICFSSSARRPESSERFENLARKGLILVWARPVATPIPPCCRIVAFGGRSVVDPIAAAATCRLEPRDESNCSTRKTIRRHPPVRTISIAPACSGPQTQAWRCHAATSDVIGSWQRRPLGVAAESRVGSYKGIYTAILFTLVGTYQLESVVPTVTRAEHPLT